MTEQIDEFSKLKIHRMIESIKLSGDFPFGESEVLENTWSVLNHFGLGDELFSVAEEAVLVLELLKLSEIEDARNAVEWAQSYYEPEHPCL